MVVSRGRRSPVVVTPAVIARVVAVFDESGSVGAAARAVGCSHSTARRVLVAAGRFPARPQPLGKPQQRAEFDAPVSPEVAVRIVTGFSPAIWVSICAIKRPPKSLNASVGPWNSSRQPTSGSTC